MTTTTDGRQVLAGPAQPVYNVNPAGEGVVIQIPDGGNVTFGAKADTAASDDTGTWTFMALFKRLLAKFTAAATLGDATGKPTTTAVGAWLFGYNGASGDLVRVQSFRVDLSAVSITSIATVWTPTSGKKFRLMGGSISVSAAVNVLFEDNSAGAGNFVWRTPTLNANTPYNFDLGNGKLSAATNNVLKATASAAATITGTLYGVEE